MYPQYDATGLYRNADGLLDNVLFLVATKEQPDASDNLWPHKGNMVGLELSVGTAGNKKGLNSYNIINTPAYEATAVGVTAHEYLHSLGAMDYYRKTTSGNPVGIWDVMAVDAAPRVWPLALTRENLGWTTIDAQAESGKITLHAPGTGKQQAFMFKSPLSDTEYFVAEYRKKGSSSGFTELDRRIGGSGLIVYRVNPSVEGLSNVNGKDYVYIFRPGETGISDSAGDVTNAQINLSGSRTSLGLSDVTKNIVDGAICYSDGRNSGITIQATSETDSSITIDLKYPNYADYDLWSPLTNQDGTGEAFGSGVQGVQTVADGSTLYTLVEQQNEWQGFDYAVRSHDGKAWLSLGSAGSKLSQGQLAFCGGTLYFMAVNEGSGKIILKKLSKGAWAEVAQLAVNKDKYSNTTTIGVVANELYILMDNDNTDVQMYKLSGSSLLPVGAKLPVSFVVSPHIFDLGGVPAVAYGDFLSRTSTVVKLKGGVWSEVAPNTTNFAHIQSTAVVDSTTYLFTYYDATKAPELSTFDSAGKLSNRIKLPSFIDCGQGANLVASGNTLYLSVVQAKNSVPEVRVYYASTSDLGTWKQLGEAVYAPGLGVSGSVKSFV